jgi:hypothetical protein
VYSGELLNYLSLLPWSPLTEIRIVGYMDFKSRQSRCLITQCKSNRFPIISVLTSRHAQRLRLQHGLCLRMRCYWHLPTHYITHYYLLTAIGLMPGSSVTKIGRTYKKWTYIARKQNIHLTKKQHTSQNFTVQYKCNEQNTRYNK